MILTFKGRRGFEKRWHTASRCGFSKKLSISILGTRQWSLVLCLKTSPPQVTAYLLRGFALELQWWDLAKVRRHSYRLQLLHKTHPFQQRIRLDWTLHAHRPKPKTLRNLGLPQPQNGWCRNIGKRRRWCQSSGLSLIQRRTLFVDHVQNPSSLLASYLKSTNNF